MSGMWSREPGDWGTGRADGPCTGKPNQSIPPNNAGSSGGTFPTNCLP